MIASLFKSLPVTFTITVTAIAASIHLPLAQWMQLDFDAVAGGQFWRIWTGHLAHWDANHLVWDLLMFLVLSVILEHQFGSRRYGLTMIPSLAIISLAIGHVCNDITTYRGLSGIDTALFVWLAADQARQCVRVRQHSETAMWLLALAGLVMKLGYEAHSGQTLFVDARDFRPLVESHLAGVLVGLVCLATVKKMQPLDAQQSTASPRPKFRDSVNTRRDLPSVSKLETPHKPRLEAPVPRE